MDYTTFFTCGEKHSDERPPVVSSIISNPVAHPFDTPLNITRKIFVSNIDYDKGANIYNIKLFFQQFGDIDHIDLKNARDCDYKGYGYVIFVKPDAAMKTLTKAYSADGLIFAGQRLVVFAIRPIPLLSPLDTVKIICINSEDSVCITYTETIYALFQQLINNPDFKPDRDHSTINTELMRVPPNLNTKQLDTWKINIMQQRPSVIIFVLSHHASLGLLDYWELVPNENRYTVHLNITMLKSFDLFTTLY